MSAQDSTTVPSSITRALHARVDDQGAHPAVTPLYQASAFEADSPFFYTRKSNPNVVELEQVVATLEGARHAVAVTTGMAAIRACLDLLSPGDTAVLNAMVYGCTYRLLHDWAQRLRIRLEVLDLTTPAGIAAIPADTRLVLFETPTNPFLLTVDIAAVVSAVRSRCRDAVVVVDNTWATPLYQHPLAHGADVSLHSATKYMSGHSDVMGGVLLADRDELAEAFRATRFYSGAILDPHSAWLLRRSMQTFSLRLAHQARVTAELAEHLAGLPQVEHVYQPRIDGHQLRGYGGIVFFSLRPDLVDRYRQLAAELRWFGTGTGMACVTSMVAQPYTGSHASMNDDEKRRMGLGPGLVRLCFGLEDPADLRADLTRALSTIDPRAIHVREANHGRHP
jgi:cystathionine beta-lyase/cystathionine gamma-synthase